MLMSREISLARGIATRAHRGQVDKIKAPYIEHPAMVAFLVQLLPDFAAADASVQTAAVCAAWLHDTIEDTSVTADSLTAVGFSSEVDEAVVALTRTPKVEPDVYYEGIRFHPVALLVKTADLASNLAPERVAQLDTDSRDWFEKKYSHALKVLQVERSRITKLHEVSAARRAIDRNTGRRSRHTVIDLHTHSNRSDGTDAPSMLVMKAYRAGITHLAITDHDTTAGWAEAAEAADGVGLHLIKGIELTTKNAGQSQHLLAYEPDPAHPGLAELLRRGLAVREARIPLMVERIAKKVPQLLLEDVVRLAGEGTPGRPHIADALVECGECTDRSDAFTRYLDRGLDTYVGRWAPSIEDAIQTVVAAGGVPIMAHPWGKKAHVTLRRFEQLRDCGLRGFEVDHLEHDASARRELAGIARTLGFITTGSSDYHGTGKRDNHLACETTDSAQFDRLQSLWSGTVIPG